MTEGSPFGFSFAHPWVLLFLFLLPILAILKGRFGGTAGVTFSTTSALSSLGRRRRSRAGALLALLTHLALASLIIALARPQLGRTLTRVEASGVDIMLALDVSRSMLAEDYTIGSQRANRIEAVKKVTEEFIRQRPNDRIGIVAFAGRPYLVSPLTLDHDWLIQNLDRLQIGLVEDGTAIGSAIASAANRLKDKEAKSKLIVLLTDGDNNAGRVTPLTATEATKALGIRMYTIGAGTNGEVPFPFTDPLAELSIEMSLCNIMTSCSGRLLRSRKGNISALRDTHTLKDVFNEIDQMEKTKVNVEKTADYRDLFPMFLLAGFVLLGSGGSPFSNRMETSPLTFSEPVWFFALAIVPVVAALYLWSQRRSDALLSKVVAPRLRSQLAGTVSKGRRTLKSAVILAVFGLIALALARPQMGFVEREVKQRGRDVIVAIDTSRSMLATDVAPSRLARAKLVAQDLLRLVRGDRVRVGGLCGLCLPPGSADSGLQCGLHLP